MSTRQLLLDFHAHVETSVLQDVENSSDQLFAESVGSQARPATNYMTEAGLFLSYAARYVANPDEVELLKMGPDPEKTQADSRRQSQIILKKGFRDIRKTIEALPEEQFSEMIMPMWKKEITKGHFLLYALAHALYHDGQLALTQLMSGDQEIHWIKAL
ncbi:hypothetical protein C0431_08125 [bacterium]|jgi:hypothetical protein|nr:hypothetical protein [bacterium]